MVACNITTQRVADCKHLTLLMRVGLTFKTNSIAFYIFTSFHKKNWYETSKQTSPSEPTVLQFTTVHKNNRFETLFGNLTSPTELIWHIYLYIESKLVCHLFDKKWIWLAFFNDFSHYHENLSFKKRKVFTVSLKSYFFIYFSDMISAFDLRLECAALSIKFAPISQTLSHCPAVTLFLLFGLWNETLNVLSY